MRVPLPEEPAKYDAGTAGAKLLKLMVEGGAELAGAAGPEGKILGKSERSGRQGVLRCCKQGAPLRDWAWELTLALAGGARHAAGQGCRARRSPRPTALTSRLAPRRTRAPQSVWGCSTAYRR